jgi:hypothetical protein
MDTNDDRAVDVNEFIVFFGRRHIASVEAAAAGGGGGEGVEVSWLPTQDMTEREGEVLAIADGPVESAEPTEAVVEKAAKKGGKGGKAKKKKAKKKK